MDILNAMSVSDDLMKPVAVPLMREQIVETETKILCSDGPHKINEFLQSHT